MPILTRGRTNLEVCLPVYATPSSLQPWHYYTHSDERRSFKNLSIGVSFTYIRRPPGERNTYLLRRISAAGRHTICKLPFMFLISSDALATCPIYSRFIIRFGPAASSSSSILFSQ